MVIKSRDLLNIIVVGASGDLAGKKIFPALFSLFCQNLLPENVRFFGFARTSFTHEDFRHHIEKSLSCRYAPGDSCGKKMKEFLSALFYVQGSYDSTESYLNLYETMRSVSDVNNAPRLFYFSIPPSLFAPVAEAIGASGLVTCSSNDFTWTRAVIEKPFGRDRESSDRLTAELRRIFDEQQLYRIDHYLGKEVVQNIIVTRFANMIFEPIWNSRHIAGVDIFWSEDIGVEGRGGYFDNYGIIRDVIQNHLLQVMSLTAMEEPASLSANSVRDRKVKLLRDVLPLTPADITVGQYSEGIINGKLHPSYRSDPTVAATSLTPTFADVIENSRWKGVPFRITAGKGLPERKSIIKIRFKASDNNIFCSLGSCPPPNELTIRIQPDEGMHLKIVNKVPGVKMQFHEKELDLSYDEAFEEYIIPDAYESLILDVVNGEKSLFIRDDELQAAWDIFTPVLHWLEEEKIEPQFYPFGTLPSLKPALNKTSS
jgi:glucose-6-phosphate 1-dehydrogenase